MTADTPFPVEPWTLREPMLDLDRLAVSESLFALSNGHIGLRADLDEGEPHGVTGTYLNSFYETQALPHAEAGYGYPEVRSNHRQRDQWENHPAARRRLALRRP